MFDDLKIELIMVFELFDKCLIIDYFRVLVMSGLRWIICWSLDNGCILMSFFCRMLLIN